MSLLLTDIDATCANLGYHDGQKYFIERDTIQSLKHLIWILRRDNETHEFRRHIGRSKVLQTDLLPMAIFTSEDVDLSDVLLRLLINLTSPTLLLYKEEMPKDSPGRRNFLELVEILQGYKEAFVLQSIWTTFGSRLQKMLEIHWNERTEEQGLHIERYLVIVRNVLQIPINPQTERCADNDASLHDQVLWALQQSGVLDLVLYIIGSEDEHQYHLHALEIIFLMYREQTADSLADANLQRSVTEKQRDEQELVLQRKRERAKQIQCLPSARHSRFGGTYVLKNIKSISDDNDLICHQTLKKAITMDFDVEKIKQKKSKRLVSEQETTKRRSAFSIRLFLREFSIEILRSAYNNLVRQVRRTLERNTDTSGHDDSYLLWAIKFFMEFNRLSGFQLDLVSESLSVTCFHWVLKCAQNNLDMIGVDKAHGVQWGRRLHITIEVYRELLLSLQTLQKVKNEKAQALFKMLQNNIFYVLEYREIVLHILINYNDMYNTKAYLCDVIETTHIFLKMMEKFCQGTIVVQEKKKYRKKGGNKRIQKKSTQNNKNEEKDDENLEDNWLRISPQLSVVLANELTLPEEDIPIPFDAALDKTIDDQKSDCMIKIHRLLKEEKFEYAISLMRSGREVWLEDDCFGSVNCVPEEELLLLKEIYFSNLKQQPEVEKPADEGGMPLIDGNCDDDYDDDDENNDDDEEEAGRDVYSETDFKFEDFANRLVNPRIVRGCTIVLTDWEQITGKALKSAVTILHRIAVGCKMPTMLYQASLFRIFQKVINTPREPHHEELRKLAVYIVRQFVIIAPKNPKIYAELLFYKTIKEANDIENGYEVYDTGARTSWSEEQEEELRGLFLENQTNPENDKDVIDWILENLIDQNRTRRGVIKKLKELGLIFKAPTKKSIADAVARCAWKYEQDEQLRVLFDQFRLDKAPLKRIMESIGEKRTKNSVIKRMIQLGLIADKSEIVPQKNKQQNKNINNEFDRSDKESTDSEESDSESNNNKARSPLMNVRIATSKKIQIKPKKVVPVKRIPLDISKAKYLLLELGDTHPTCLAWLTESLEEALEDIEDATEDPDDGIPLVPITQEAMTAMDNKQFLQLLIIIGFQKPQKDMETFWRIPIHWTADDLKIRTKLLKGIYDDTDLSDTTKTTIQESIVNENENQNSISENQKQFNLRLQQIENIIYNTSDSDNEYRTSLTSDVDDDNKKNKKKKKKNNKKSVKTMDKDVSVRSNSNKINGHDKKTTTDDGDNIDVENETNEDEDDENEQEEEENENENRKVNNDDSCSEDDFDFVEMRKRLSKLIDNNSDNDNNDKKSISNNKGNKSNSNNVKKKSNHELIDLNNSKNDEHNKSLNTIVTITKKISTENNHHHHEIDDDDIDTDTIELSSHRSVSLQDRKNINKKRERSTDSDTSISNENNFNKKIKKRARQILSDDDDDADDDNQD